MVSLGEFVVLRFVEANEILGTGEILEVVDV